MAAPAARGDEQIKQKDRRHAAPGHHAAENERAVHQADGIDRLPHHHAGGGAHDQHGAQNPVAQLALGRAAGGDVEAPAQPRRAVGHHVDRAHPTAEHAAADEGVEHDHDRCAQQCGGLRPVAPGDHLCQQERVGQRQRVQRQARRQVALDEPHARQRAEHEQREDRQLRQAPQHQPLVRLPPAFFADGLGARAGCFVFCSCLRFRDGRKRLAWC